jgi:hypothetical protein
LTSTFGPITSSSHVFTNSKSTKPDFFSHEICCLLWSFWNGFSFENYNRLYTLAKTEIIYQKNVRA